MSVMANYARIFWSDPKDDDVARRNEAVTTLKAWINDMSPPWKAVELASDIAQSFSSGAMGDNFAQIVERSIVDAGSSAFVRGGAEREILVVMAVAALDLIRRDPPDTTAWEPVGALSAALWSALSYQPVVGDEKMEMLRQEVCTAARERTMKVAEKSRGREVVPEIGPLTIPENAPTGSRANTAYRRATEPLIKALRENAELDREELEFLWWKIEDWNEALQCTVSSLTPAVRAVASGIDGATILRRLPASGHRNVILRGVEPGTLLPLPALLAEFGDRLAAIVTLIDNDRVGTAPDVFPLLSALTGVAPLPGGDLERDARDWGARALLEAGILNIDRREATQP